VRRDIRVLGHTARVSLLADRRVSRPYGLCGGAPGASGRDVLIGQAGESPLPCKGVVSVGPDEIISIRTPGGGGYGEPDP